MLLAIPQLLDLVAILVMLTRDCVLHCACRSIIRRNRTSFPIPIPAMDD
jgi:hypothetical protein